MLFISSCGSDTTQDTVTQHPHTRIVTNEPTQSIPKESQKSDTQEPIKLGGGIGERLNNGQMAVTVKYAEFGDTLNDADDLHLSVKNSYLFVSLKIENIGEETIKPANMLLPMGDVHVYYGRDSQNDRDCVSWLADMNPVALPLKPIPRGSSVEGVIVCGRPYKASYAEFAIGKHGEEMRVPIFEKPSQANALIMHGAIGQWISSPYSRFDFKVNSILYVHGDKDNWQYKGVTIPSYACAYGSQVAPGDPGHCTLMLADVSVRLRQNFPMTWGQDLGLGDIQIVLHGPQEDYPIRYSEKLVLVMEPQLSLKHIMIGEEKRGIMPFIIGDNVVMVNNGQIVLELTDPLRYGELQVMPPSEHTTP